MASFFISPIATILQFFSEEGVVLAGGKVHTYVANSSTPIVTYTDSTGGVQNANPIVLNSDGRLPASVWAPTGSIIKMVLADADDAPIPGGTINNLPLLNDITSISQAIVGLALYPRNGFEIASSVVPLNYAYPPLNVWRYAAPGQVAVGGDDTVAIQTALEVATSSGSTGRGLAVYVPPGTYLISAQLTIANATVMYGDGRQQTIIRPKTGFTGVMITDKGNASKIFLKHMRIERLAITTCTGLIRFGYGASPFAQAELYDLFIAGAVPGTQHTPGTFKALDIVSNVASFTEIEASNCDYAFFEGPNSSTTVYTRCYSVDGGVRDFSIAGNAVLENCEIEAPQTACVPIYVAGQAKISGLVLSQNNAVATTNDHVVELAATVTSFEMDGFVHFNGSGTSTLTHVVKDLRTGFPTYWADGGGAQRRVALLGDDLFHAVNQFRKDHKHQEFRFRLINSTGIKHLISSLDVTVASAYADRITGASITPTATPTGADGATAFAAGAKIGSANTNAIWLNSGDQVNGTFWAKAAIVFNTSTVPLIVAPTGVISININGVTRHYVGLFFYDAGTGAAYNLTTLGAGLIIDVNFEGWVL